MQLEIIRTPEAFEQMADEWNALLVCSASHVPFLRHEYLFAWWRTLGGGEWTQGELYIVAARNSQGSLVGVAPMFLTKDKQGEPVVMLVGSIEISDFLDILACPDAVEPFVGKLLDHLDSPEAPAWRSLDWYNLLDSSPTLPALDHAARQRGWAVVQEPMQHCPYIPLPGDWETYLARIDKKQRHEIRRKMRRLEEGEAPSRWYIVTDPASLTAEIDAFLNLMANDPDKEAFLSSAMRAQMHLALCAAFEAGWLQLAFLEIGGEKAAGYLNFDYDNHIWVYNSGLDFRFREVSPGWVLLGYLLQWANENKRRAFDFMRGDEEYKYRFGAIDRRVVRITLKGR